ncbi:hypothetical protein D3C72_1183560 [compost metagenome]
MGLHGVLVGLPLLEIEHEGDAHAHLALGHIGGLRLAAAGVGSGVLVELLEVVKRLVFAHQLHQPGDHRIGRAAGGGVRNLHFALELGLDHIGPAQRLGQFLFLQDVGVVAKADGRAVETAHLVARHGVLAHAPVPQVIDVGRTVFGQQALLGRLQERIARTAPPDIGLGVVGLGTQLGGDLARALVRLVHLDAGLLGELLGRSLAPGRIGAAQRIDHALRLGARGKCCQHGGCGKTADVEGCHGLAPGCVVSIRWQNVFAVSKSGGWKHPSPEANCDKFMTTFGVSRAACCVTCAVAQSPPCLIPVSCGCVPPARAEDDCLFWCPPHLSPE